MAKLELGTLCLTRGSRVPVLNDGLIVIVVSKSWMNPDPKHYTIAMADGTPLPMVGDCLYSIFKAPVPAWRLVPLADQSPANAEALRKAKPADTRRLMVATRPAFEDDGDTVVEVEEEELA